MTTIYEKALADAEKELLQVTAEIAERQKRKAQLETMISGIKAALGHQFEERGLTDSIRTVLKATDLFLSAEDVTGKLSSFIANVNPVSVSSILSRMAKDKEAITGQTERGRIGYKWWTSEVNPKPGLLIDTADTKTRKKK